MGITDKEAIKQVLTGDRDAYRILMDRHFQFVFRVAFRITGNQSDAEDVAQEAFLKAYHKLDTFRQDATFTTWINRIAMNIAINLMERRNRDLTHHASGIAEDSNFARDTRQDTRQVPDHKAGPERLLLDRETITIRQAAMSTLTPMERTAFTLRHMEDFGIPQIADALNIPANSAKQAVFRAVAKLRRALAPLAGGLRG